tara:strand:+ start:347 stop:757 length:411 start_codon:yes stop_codon:yes gene_type:complete
MRHLYSNVKKDLLLHTINRYDEIVDGRTDLSPEEQYIQVSSLKMLEGKTFNPHKHIKQIRTSDICQESWVVIEGSVKVTLYDIDDTIIEEVILNKGDISITYNGGHNYTSLQDGTVVYEYKTGPYLGREYDKEDIR